MSDKSVSKWERGICLPDVSIYTEICRVGRRLVLGPFRRGQHRDVPERGRERACRTKHGPAVPSELFELRKPQLEEDDGPAPQAQLLLQDGLEASQPPQGPDAPVRGRGPNLGGLPPVPEGLPTGDEPRGQPAALQQRGDVGLDAVEILPLSLPGRSRVRPVEDEARDGVVLDVFGRAGRGPSLDRKSVV